MRLLISSLNYTPEPTATGKYTGEMAEALAAKDCNVTVFAAPPHYPQWEVFDGYKNRGFFTEFYKGVTVRRVPCFIPRLNKVSGLTRILMELSYTFSSIVYWLPVLLSRRRYDVVIAICPPMQTALFPLIYSKLRKVPFIFHIQDFQVDMAFRLGMLKPNLFNRMLYKLEAFLLRGATYVSSITDAMLQRAQEKGVAAEQLIYLPNWANIEHVKPGEKYNAFRDSLGYSRSDFIVLYSGGMGVKQGLEILLDAAEALAARADIHFLVVGDGGAKSSLVDQADVRGLTNIQFLPLQRYEKLPVLLALSDVNLIIQREEASDFVMPSKLTNILAAGRPVIATATAGTGLHKVIQEHRLGLTCQPGSATGLVDCIEELSVDHSRLQSIGASARAYAEHHLDKDKILSRFAQQLKAVVRGDQPEETEDRNKAINQ